MDKSQSGKRRILLGQIVRVHGVRGEVIVRAFTADPSDIAAYGALTDRDGHMPLSLSIVRVSDKGVVARVKGVSDRNGAEALRGRELYVLRSALPDAEDDEYYHADLIGLEAVAPGGEVLGIVVAIPNYGAGDLIEIERPGTRATELIPFTDDCVPDIDLATGRLTVVMPTMTGEPEPQSEDGEDDDDA